jgi:hypothetical protein
MGVQIENILRQIRKEQTMLDFTSLYRRQAMEAFNEMCYRGIWNQVWNTLVGGTPSLPTFNETTLKHLPHRQYLGLQEIPLQQIIGSIGRSQDFGPRFHPLRKSLQDRWTQIFLLAREDRWEPVRLVKNGSHYFVEDGNHRVSVAHFLGRRFVDAEVWEYPVVPIMNTKRPISGLTNKPLRRFVNN